MNEKVSFFDIEPFRRAETAFGAVPAVDVTQTDKGYEITAELPGMEEKDIDVNKWKNCPAFHGGCPYTHSHVKLLKDTAVKILTGEDLEEILAPNFVAVLKSTPHAGEDINKAKFQEFSSNFHAKNKWKAVPLLTVSEGNTVVVRARYDGVKEGHEIKDFETVIICTFNEDAKVEKLYGLSDLGTYAQNMGVPLKVE